MLMILKNSPDSSELRNLESSGVASITLDLFFPVDDRDFLSGLPSPFSFFFPFEVAFALLSFFAMVHIIIYSLAQVVVRPEFVPFS